MEWAAQIVQNLDNIIQALGPADVLSALLDIAVVSYLIYRLMLLVSRTSTANVARAILLLVVVLWVSELLHLRVINFILGRTLELGLLALIVIFQPELRKVLEQLGNNRLKNFFAKEAESSELDAAITQTATAYTALSKDRVGALMIFERDNLLDDVIKTGTALDCAVEAALLKNIFWNKAPLHDGAVIVRGGRIVGAGCMLPMTASTTLSKDLGMRHRAAVGISERSDAVAAVVSEETGSISLAVGGNLMQHLAPEKLEQFLRSELMPQQQEEERKDSFLSGLFKSKKGGEGDGKEDSQAQ